MKLFLICLSLALPPILGSTHGYADEKKPIFINRVEPTRNTDCLRKVKAVLGGTTYALSRIKTMEYWDAEGNRITNKNPKHPFRDCKITDIGIITRFITGYTKSGISFEAQIITDPEKAKTYSTYSDRRDFIVEKFKSKDYERLSDLSIMMQWESSIIYLISTDKVKTGNGEPVALYCKVPAGIKLDETTTWDERRKICSSNYFLPNGVAFGYTFIEPRYFLPFSFDERAREIFATLLWEKSKQITVPAQ
jgi:hypothetical protein